MMKWAKLGHDPTTGFTGLVETRVVPTGRHWQCMVCQTAETTDRPGLPADWAERWITPHHPLVVCGRCRHREGMG